MDEDDKSSDTQPRSGLRTPSPAPPSPKGKARALDACVICLEPVTERAIAVPCNHCAFDFLCLASWLQASPACPLCKAPISAVQYDWRAPHDYKTYAVRPDPPRRPNIRQAATSRTHPPARRRPPPPPARNPSEALALARRRAVYEQRLFSLHVGANRLSQHREITPALFDRTPALQRRARAWIRRELQVFAFLSPDGPGAEHPTAAARALRRVQNAEFVLEYVVSVLRTVDVREASGRAQEMVGELLGVENAQLFLHELNAWLRSPYTDLADWDRHVQYRKPLPGAEQIDRPQR